MTNVVRIASPSFPPPHKHPRPRDTIVAGYIITLEDGAFWANKVRNDPNRVLPGNIRFSPTVLDIIDKDFQKHGGLGVHYNVLDARDEASTTRYLVATQMEEGMWWNNSQEATDRERVDDPAIRLVEGDEDRKILARLQENALTAH